MGIRLVVEVALIFAGLGMMWYSGYLFGKWGEYRRQAEAVARRERG